MSAATAKARPAARPELRRDEVHELRLVEGTRPRRSSGRAAGRAFAVAALMRGPSIHG